MAHCSLLQPELSTERQTRTVRFGRRAVATPFRSRSRPPGFGARGMGARRLPIPIANIAVNLEIWREKIGKSELR